MSPTHRAEVVLSQDGKLTLEDIPFRAGDSVEVTVTVHQSPMPAGHPLSGSVLYYDRPTDPVGEAHWGATR